MLGAIYDSFVSTLQGVEDCINFGPIAGFKINASVCPEYERMSRTLKSGRSTNMEDKDSDIKFEGTDESEKDMSSEEITKFKKEIESLIGILGIRDMPIFSANTAEKNISNTPAGELFSDIIRKHTEATADKKCASSTDKKCTSSTDKNSKKGSTALALLPKTVEADIVVNKITVDRIISNISTAIHEFTVEEEIDRQLIMCFIAAYYKYNNRIDKEVLDQILVTDEDRTMYISILRWFDSVKAGYPYKAGRILLQDSVVKELKDLLNWQISYDNEHVSAAQALNIKKGFEDILENLKGLKQDIIVEPITVTVGKQIPKSGYTDEEKKTILQRLETDFAEILKDHKESGLLTYKFNILSDIAELIVIDKDLSGAPARYRIDPGIIIGNGTNLIYYVTEQDGVARDIYVNVNKRPEIVKNIIDNPGYNMTPEDIQKSFADYFTVKQIYYYIDMSSFSTHISTFKQQKMDQLENKLTAVFNILNTQNGIPEGRFRLKEWKGIDNFTLISDKDCRSPFASNGSTCGDIVSGMTISIIKDNITVTYKDPANLGKVNEAKFAIMH